MHDMETHSSPHIMGRVKHIHFIGIGGAGMGGIAEVLKTLGIIAMKDLILIKTQNLFVICTPIIII